LIATWYNGRERRRYDEYLYRLRHPAESAFAEMKRWRGIATWYTKNATSYLTAVHTGRIVMWARIY
jgi:transposase